MSKYKYILLGNSAAAVTAAEAIRTIDKENSLAIVSAEDSAPYSPALTTYFISGTINEKGIYYRSDDFYSKNKIDTFLANPATSLDAKKKTVTLADGTVLQFSKLLIATGGAPQRPDIKGSELKGVFTLRTMDDARQIKERAQNSEKAVILGGGLVGLRAAYALHHLGINVTIVVSSSQILSQNLDEKAAGIMQDWLAYKHFNIVTKNDVDFINGEDEVTSVTLKDGTELAADMVIIGKGVRPNASFSIEAGIEVDRGIVVNNLMQTSVEDIYAAGDVAQAYDKLLKKKVVNAIWPVATEQGRVVGTNMAGGSEKFEGSIAMNSVDFYGLSALSMGITRPKNEKDYEIIEKYEPQHHLYRKLLLQDNVIKGAILIGDIDRAGIITGLINEGVKVDSFKDSLSKDKFGFMVLPKELRDKKMTSTRSS